MPAVALLRRGAVGVLDEGDDSHLSLTLEALKRIHKEHLLVSKALPIFLAPHYFCACSDLSLLCEAYDLSTQS